MDFGPIVIVATKTPNVVVAPTMKLVILIFMGIKSSYLLPICLSVVRGMML